jgi:hypothetical protein
MPSCPFCRMRLPTGDELQDHIKKKHPKDASETFHHRGMGQCCIL